MMTTFKCEEAKAKYRERFGRDTTLRNDVIKNVVRVAANASDDVAMAMWEREQSLALRPWLAETHVAATAHTAKVKAKREGEAACAEELHRTIRTAAFNPLAEVIVFNEATADGVASFEVNFRGVTYQVKVEQKA